MGLQRRRRPARRARRACGDGPLPPGVDGGRVAASPPRLAAARSTSSASGSRRRRRARGRRRARRPVAPAVHADCGRTSRSRSSARRSRGAVCVVDVPRRRTTPPPRSPRRRGRPRPSSCSSASEPLRSHRADRRAPLRRAACPAARLRRPAGELVGGVPRPRRPARVDDLAARFRLLPDDVAAVAALDRASRRLGAQRRPPRARRARRARLAPALAAASPTIRTPRARRRTCSCCRPPSSRRSSRSPPPRARGRGSPRPGGWTGSATRASRRCSPASPAPARRSRPR